MRLDVLDRAIHEPAGTPARLLDAAEAEFAEHGYRAASTREIARRAGVPFGAVHYHWGSKRLLWQAVFERLTGATRETVLANLAPGDSLGEVLDRMTDAFVELFAGNRTLTRLCCRMFLEPPDPHVRSIQDMFRDLLQMGVGILEQRFPGTGIDAPVTILVLSNAFVSALADEAAHETLLGGSVFTHRPTRERLRAELRRFARAAFNARE